MEAAKAARSRKKRTNGIIAAGISSPILLYKPGSVRRTNSEKEAQVPHRPSSLYNNARVVGSWERYPAQNMALWLFPVCMHKRGCRSCCTNYSADWFRHWPVVPPFRLHPIPANGNKVQDSDLPGEFVHQILSRNLDLRLADTRSTCAEYRFPQIMKEARWKKKVRNKESTDTTVGRTDHNQANFSDATNRPRDFHIPCQ